MLNFFVFLIIFTISVSYGKGTHSFTLSAGRYIVKCCGAQGGAGKDGGKKKGLGGKGACVMGTMDVTGLSTQFYAYVGGKGEENDQGLSAGGFNGGGMSGKDTLDNDGSGGGGGATDLRIIDKAITSRIIVAAGGSGGAGECNGAPGGTLTGFYATGKNEYAAAPDVNQDGGIKDGVGGNGVDSTWIPGSGGGGGYRGGYESGSDAFTNDYLAVAKSGSSYISGHAGCITHKKMKFTSTSMNAGKNENDGKMEITTVFKCPSHCISCNNASSCTKCQENYFLINNTCMLCPTTKGYYKTSSGTCTKCDASCKTCRYLKTRCSSCNAGFFLHENKCVNECPDGFYPSGSSCLACKYPCSTCNKSSTKCISCVGNLSLYENKCYINCPERTYKTNEKTCEKCDEKCLSCLSEATNCAACNEGFYLYENQCVADCPEKTVSYEGHCVSCKSPCASCNEKFDICTSCINGFYLYQNKCYVVCPSGTTQSGNQCV